MEKTNADKLVMMIGKLNKSRLEVAVYLGVSERTVYRWMSGKARFPRMVFLALELMGKEE
jgi:transcriptional regulator with XRE-family HTH domain